MTGCRHMLDLAATYQRSAEAELSGDQKHLVGR
jgi:hypothetical protein